MDRQKVAQLTRQELDKHNLTDWGVRIAADLSQHSFLGMCIYKDKVIMLNSHHCDIHSDADIMNTIRHEVAHALTAGHGHDEVWRAKATEIGCDNNLPCSHLGFPDHVIDAIRSGKVVEFTIEEEQVTVRHPKYKITQLKDLCPICGKTAVERFRKEYIDKKTGNTIQLNTLSCFHVIRKEIPKGTAFDELVTNWWRPHVKECKHEWVKTKCIKCGEFKLMQFQIASAAFVEKALALQKGAGVFHEMGLGKTIIVLAYLKFHKKKTLFVVKSATYFQWFKETVRILGPEAMPQIIRSSKDFIFPGLRSYIISYDLLRRMDQDKMKELGIEVVVLDECQQIKNPDSTRTKEVRKLVGGNDVKVVALSGSPWKNRGSEFFAVLNMMDPIKFHSYQHFLDTWVSYYWHGDKRKEGGIKNPDRFKQYIDTLAIRFEYNEVMAEFPDVNRMKLNMQMDEMDQSAYDDETSDFVKWYNQFVIDGTEDSIDNMEILARLTRMRHITGLAKIPATVGFMEEFYEDTDRNMVIFVHHKDVARILIAELKKKFSDVNVEALSAEQSPEEKSEVIKRYQQKRTFLVASTIACGEGIDGLQTGYDSILHERQWNPMNEDQATPGRFKRIGQQSPIINVTCVQAEGTVDEHLDMIVETKRNEFHKAMNKGEMKSWVESDIIKQLGQLIVQKHKEKNKNKPVSDKPKVKISEIASL